MRVWASDARLRKCSFSSLVYRAAGKQCIWTAATCHRQVVAPMHTCRFRLAGEHPGPFDHHLEDDGHAFENAYYDMKSGCK